MEVGKSKANKSAINAGLKTAELSAVIIRADGTRENLGVISAWYKTPSLWTKFKQWVRRLNG